MFVIVGVPNMRTFVLCIVWCKQNLSEYIIIIGSVVYLILSKTVVKKAVPQCTVIACYS